MPEMRRMKPLLGTYVEVAQAGTGAAGAIEAAFDSIALAQALWSFQDPASELSRLNRSPGAVVPLSASTLRLLRAARAITAASGGAFDCTLGGTLVALGVLPDHGGAEPLARGGAGDIEIGRGWARLRRPVRITLDGIAKGFAVDLAVRAMRRAGAHGGWINAGGDIRVFGDSVLPVQRRELDGSYRPLGSLRRAAMASSRSGARDAAFPAHIIGLGQGTAASGIWTVVAATAWRADALTKVAAAAPPATRAGLVASLGGAMLEPVLEAAS
ncbi:MAG: FAD:protein FMN transferase [Bdellovibrionales bacterium]|nr:FAD:protein FMN transferase [Massilia sp.]